ncbi:hypothetical protein D3C72_1452730 [compost metagenome]
MELDVIDAVAAAVIAGQARRAAVGLGAGRQRLRAAQPGAMRAQVARPGIGALPAHGIAQSRVGIKQGIVFQGRDLVEHGMRREL